MGSAWAIRLPRRGASQKDLSVINRPALYAPNGGEAARAPARLPGGGRGLKPQTKLGRSWDHCRREQARDLLNT